VKLSNKSRLRSRNVSLFSWVIYLEYEQAYISFLSLISLKQADLVKKVLLEMPKKVIHNFENPLILSDFLTHYLN
jgi:hypothetical protein